ncbi:hypothetical protein VZT92_023160 [Zoarces viviparus]|uniref:Uncharacterized protein n=1 Tax=Zoarces viviparus TaxID=48416 RepID=A0AAW1E5E7_ZOAVI
MTLLAALPLLSSALKEKPLQGDGEQSPSPGTVQTSALMNERGLGLLVGGSELGPPLALSESNPFRSRPCRESVV